MAPQLVAAGLQDAFPVVDVDELLALAGELGIPAGPGRFVSEAGECVAALVRASRAAALRRCGQDGGDAAGVPA